jgi:hypothetical protein
VKRTVFNAFASAPYLPLIGWAIRGSRPHHAHAERPDWHRWARVDACWLSRRYQAGWFALGVTQLKVKKEEGAGAVIGTTPIEDAATFRRSLFVGLAAKS